MTDVEYQVLDELYFIVSFEQLCEQTRLSETVVLAALESLFAKKWIKCFVSLKEELPEALVNLPGQYRAYYYLASKGGLFALHSR